MAVERNDMRPWLLPFTLETWSIYHIGQNTFKTPSPSQIRWHRLITRLYVFPIVSFNKGHHGHLPWYKMQSYWKFICSFASPKTASQIEFLHLLMSPCTVSHVDRTGNVIALYWYKRISIKAKGKPCKWPAIYTIEILQTFNRNEKRWEKMRNDEERSFNVSEIYFELLFCYKLVMFAGGLSYIHFIIKKFIYTFKPFNNYTNIRLTCMYYSS